MKQSDIAKEKQLYGLFLDLEYSEGAYADRVEELADELKETKKSLAKTKKSLVNCIAKYKELNGGVAPRSARRGK